MTWLTWRQLRAQATALSVLVAGFATTLAITGPRLARLKSNVFDQLTKNDHRLFYAGVVVLAAAPALIGAFWGAPLVARELETGTHQLVWNQSVTRTRWLATKLGCTVAAAAAAVGALSLAVTWWAQPLDGAHSQTQGNLPARLTPVTFGMRGVAPVAYVVFAVLLGTAIGLVLRRTLPAMALTTALVVASQLAVPLWIRPHLLAPTSATVTLSRQTLDSISSSGPGSPTRITARTPSPGDWMLSNVTVASDGRHRALPRWFGDCLPAPVTQSDAPRQAPAVSIDRCIDRLGTEGYRQHVTYHPASQFWALQWAETALYLTVSALLAGFCFWWMRSRLS